MYAPYDIMDNEVAILYCLSALFSLLLSISEALGWSGFRANSISEVVLEMIKARIATDEANPVNVPHPVAAVAPDVVTVADKSSGVTPTSSWSS